MIYDSEDFFNKIVGRAVFECLKDNVKNEFIKKSNNLKIDSAVKENLIDDISQILDKMTVDDLSEYAEKIHCDKIVQLKNELGNK